MTRLLLALSLAFCLPGCGVVQIYTLATAMAEGGMSASSGSNPDDRNLFTVE